jgi:hypothetical protein
MVHPAWEGMPIGTLQDRFIQILQCIFLVFVVYETCIILVPYFLDVKVVLSQDFTTTQDNTIICNESIDSIMKLFRSIQFHNLNNRNSTGKFIMYQAPSGSGLGNRIPPLVSTALLAILVGRGFLVHWPEEEIETNTQQEVRMMVQFRQLFDPPFTIDAAQIPGFYNNLTNENTIRFSLEAHMADILLCRDIISMHNDKRLIIFHGWRPFFDLLMHNEGYSAKWQSWESTVPWSMSSRGASWRLWLR